MARLMVSVMLEDWRWLAETASGRALAAAAMAASAEGGGVAAGVVGRLRKMDGATAERAAAAVSLARGRRKLAAKGVPDALRWWVDDEAAQEATPWAVACWKAARMRAALDGGPGGAGRGLRDEGDGIPAVLDLCCGAGVDAAAMRAHGLRGRVVDVDDLRLWQAGRNLALVSPGGAARGLDWLAFEAAAESARAGDERFACACVHIDPERRSPLGRAKSVAVYSPDQEVLRRLVGDFEHACIKLSPAVDRGEAMTLVPEGMPRTLGFVGLGRRLVEADLWTGALAGAGTGTRLAVRLDAGRTGGQGAGPDSVGFETATLSGEADDVYALPIDGDRDAASAGWVHAIHPAVERAELIGTMLDSIEVGGGGGGGWMAHARVGLLLSDARLDSPWLEPYRVRAAMGWRASRVKRWLRDHGGGLVTVKTIGGVVDTDRVQRELRGTGATAYTVFVHRVGKRVVAWLTESD